MDHWIRVVVMICSLGFIFPNAITEYDPVEPKTSVERDANIKS